MIEPGNFFLLGELNYEFLLEFSFPVFSFSRLLS